MLKFNRVVARDTFAYKYLDFSFESGIHKVVGINGASKTSIFLTLMQGLFNKNAKGMKIDDVNNRVTEEPYEIEIWFEKGSKEYWVKNSKKTGKIEITENGVDKSLKRIPDNLKRIEDILGCDYAMFVALVYQSPDSSINLLETNSDGERKKFINRINRLDELDFHLERMKAKEKELTGKTGRIATLQRNIEVLEGSLTELQEELQEIDQDTLAEEVKERSEYVSTMKNDMVLLNKERMDLKAELETCERNSSKVAELAELEFLASSVVLPEATEEYLSEGLNTTRAELAHLTGELRDATSLLSRARIAEKVREQLEDMRSKLRQVETPEHPLDFVEDQFAKITRLRVANSTKNTMNMEERDRLQKAAAKGMCPTCGQGVLPDRFETDVARLSSEITEAEALIAKCDTSLIKYGKYKQAWDTIHSLSSKIASLEAHPDINLLVGECEEKVDARIKEGDRVQEREREFEVGLSFYRSYKELESKINALKATLGPQGDLESIKGKYESVVKNCEIVKDTLNTAEQYVATLQSELDAAKDHNAMARARRELNKSIAANNSKLQAQLADAGKELYDAEETLEYIKTWVAILGSKGYRVHKIKRFLKNINSTMDRYSGMISNNRIRCEFFIDDAGEIDFTVTDAHKAICFAGWSNGEKARIKLACLFAVLEILEMMGTVYFNVLALDEVFGSLDDEGKEGLFRVLHYLQDKGKCIYTIAHSELVLPMTYDSVIKAEKLEDGTTRIIQ